jgi:hypothetical protein
MTDITDITKAISIDKLNDRTVITYKKSKIVGLATPSDVMNSVLIAARMQAEKYIEKLAKGDTLTDKEVSALAQLASITKIQTTPEAIDKLTVTSATDVEILKSTFYAKLLEKKD